MMGLQNGIKKRRKNKNDLRSREHLQKGIVFVNEPDYLFVRANGKYVRVNFSELICIRGKRGWIQVVTESESLITMNNISEITELLPIHLFCRIHHSYIVAVNRIKAFDNDKVYLYGPIEGEKFKPGMASAKELPIGAFYRRNLKKSIWLLPSKVGAKSKAVKESEFLLECTEQEELN